MIIKLQKSREYLNAEDDSCETYNDLRPFLCFFVVFIIFEVFADFGVLLFFDGFSAIFAYLSIRESKNLSDWLARASLRLCIASIKLFAAAFSSFSIFSILSRRSASSASLAQQWVPQAERCSRRTKPSGSVLPTSEITQTKVTEYYFPEWKTMENKLHTLGHSFYNVFD